MKRWEKGKTNCQAVLVENLITPYCPGVTTK